MKRLKLLTVIACIVTMLIPQTVLAAEESAVTEGGTIIGLVETPVYYGSYPQREVVVDKSDCGTTGRGWATDDDCIVDATLYCKLLKATWDSNGDTEIDGVRYHKLTKSEATFTVSDNSLYFNWGEDDECFFRYDPIKWRVLDRDGDDLFVVADVALDDQQYHTSGDSITWEDSTIRRWLNGTFYNRAFSSDEQSFIKTTDVVNNDNKNYGTNGGNDTQDKIFLLSEDEVYGTYAPMYGFAKSYNTYDTARQFKSSTYAKAMGIWSSIDSSSLGNCGWWLRSPGGFTSNAANVNFDGDVYRDGCLVFYDKYGILPALHINLKSNNLIGIDMVSASDVKLSSTEMEYDGTELKPTVSIKNLTEGTDYTVSYSNNKDIGTGIVTIEGIGDFSGTITKTFTIIKHQHNYVHKKVAAGNCKDGSEYDECQGCHTIINKKTIAGYSTSYVKSMKLVAAKKACTVKWAKQSSANQKKFTAYQIQYSTDKSFKKSVKTTTAKKSSSYKKISKLTSKKTYYVRVRTYTTKSGKKYYSKWTTKSTRIK